MKKLKLVVIGGGSSYTPELAEGLIKRHASFPVGELVLVDVEAGREKVQIIAGLLERMFRRTGLNIPVSLTFDRRAALPGADFVVSQFRAGGLEARARDESIPLKYGMIGQETTGPGGFANALRTIPEALAICRDMEELCPDAWLINFTNPSGIITEAILTHTRIKCLGLCNIAINMINAAAGILGVERSRLDCRFVGLNHLSFMTSLKLDGQEMLRDLAAAVSSRSRVKNISDTALPDALLKALGLIPSSYLKYYYLEKQMLDEMTTEFERAGKTRAQEVMNVERRLFELYRNEGLDHKPEELSKRGGALYSEAAVALMDSIYNDRQDIQVVNTLNRGCLPDLPPDAAVEVSCRIGKAGAKPLPAGSLPLQVRGLIQQVKAYEQLTIQAAITGDRDTALIALINNPLVHDASAAKTMLDEILSSNRDYLEAFFREECGK